MKTIRMEIDDELHKALKMKAAKEGVTMLSIISGYLQELKKEVMGETKEVMGDGEF